MAGTAMRLWPCRSISRLILGTISTAARSPLPATSPASAYESRTVAIITTVLMPYMDSGNRARKPAEVNARLPWWENSLR